MLRQFWCGWALVGLGCMLPLPGVSAVRAQTAPAGVAEPTMMLDFHDVPVESALTTMAEKLGLTIVKRVQIPDKITVTSAAPVEAHEAAVLLNAQLWPLGYRIYSSTASPADKRLILRIVSRDELQEFRTWPMARLPAYPALLPAEMPGVSATATMLLRVQDVPLSGVLDQFATAFGFVIEPPPDLMGNERVTIVAPKALTARQAADLLSDWLELWGYQIQGKAVPDGNLATHTLLRVVKMQAEPKPETAAFAFQDAPLSVVLAELGKRSGLAIADSTVGVHVTIDQTLEVDAKGKGDVGELVKKLNELLTNQSVIIEPAGVAGADGRVLPGLSAMPVDMARRTLLTPQPDTEPETLPPTEWIGIDPKATMNMRYENVPVETILANMGQAFGFTETRQMQLMSRLTIETPNPVTAGEAFELLNEALLPLGYQAVVIPSESLQGTILCVMPMLRARVVVRKPAPAPAATAASPAKDASK